MGWDGMGSHPPPVLTGPEAPSPEVLWQTCQVVPGSPVLDSGYKASADPGCLNRSEAQHMPMHMHTCPHNNANPWS